MKSLIGMGIFFSTYSQTTSMLYLSWAEIGMIGAPSATVPVGDGITWVKYRGEKDSNCICSIIFIRKTKNKVLKTTSSEVYDINLDNKSNVNIYILTIYLRITKY